MLIGPSEQRVATTLDLLVGHLPSPQNFQESSDVGHVDISFPGEVKILHSTLSTTKKEARCLLGLFGLWRQHICHFFVLLWPIYGITWKDASFKWALEWEKVLQQVQAAMQTYDLWLRPYVKAEPMLLEVPIANREQFWTSEIKKSFYWGGWKAGIKAFLKFFHTFIFPGAHFT